MDAPLHAPPFHPRSPWITPTQAVALGLVAASMGWAVWLLRDRPNTDEIELLAGMVLPSSEMAIMEAAFDRAQLVDHRTDGGRVWVPRSRQSAYMRALVDAEALPREFGGSLRRALEKNSPWQSRAAQDELLRVAMQEELSLVICSMPGIERAAVLYDTESRAGFEGGVQLQPAKTASVNVCTQPDTELDPARVQAIRVLVSASIAGLAPERVAVTDLRSGRVHAGPLDAESDRDESAAAAADPTLARKIAHERHLASKVRQALAFIKGAAIDVTVEFGGTEQDPAPVPPAPALLDGGLTQQLQKPADANAPASIQPQAAVAATRPAAVVIAADTTPNAILVSVAVPESYVQAACRAAAERAGQPTLEPLAIEQQEMDRIRQTVLSILPATRDPARRRVTVSFFPTATTTTARREQPHVGGRQAARPETGPRSTTARPLGEIAALVFAGRFEEVPRHVWLAATSVCVGLLAGLLWWAGGRSDRVPSAAIDRRLRQPRIDWSAMEEDADGTASTVTRATGGARAAALLLALLFSTAGAAPAADPEPTPQIAPLPEAILQEEAVARPAHDANAPATLSPASALDGRGHAPQVLSALPLDRGTGTSTAGNAAASGGRAFGDWKLLATIVAAFAVLVAASRFGRRRTAPLPPDVFEVLGEAPLAGPHAIRIVRFGPKTLLIGVSAGGCHTLAELSDPQATSCIAAACRCNAPIRARAATGGDGPRRSLPAQPPRAVGEAA